MTHNIAANAASPQSRSYVRFEDMEHDSWLIRAVGKVVDVASNTWLWVVMGGATLWSLMVGA